jgi:hypothetical protein
MGEDSGFCGNWKEDDNLEDTGVDGGILMIVKGMRLEGVDCISVVEDRDKWRGRANGAMNSRVA